MIKALVKVIAAEVFMICAIAYLKYDVCVLSICLLEISVLPMFFAVRSLIYAIIDELK